MYGSETRNIQNTQTNSMKTLVLNKISKKKNSNYLLFEIIERKYPCEMHFEFYD